MLCVEDVRSNEGEPPRSKDAGSELDPHTIEPATEPRAASQAHFI